MDKLLRYAYRGRTEFLKALRKPYLLGVLVWDKKVYKDKVVVIVYDGFSFKRYAFYFHDEMFKGVLESEV